MIKGISETIGNIAKKQKCRFVDILLSNLDSSLLSCMHAEKEVLSTGSKKTKININITS